MLDDVVQTNTTETEINKAIKKKRKRKSEDEKLLLYIKYYERAIKICDENFNLIFEIVKGYIPTVTYEMFSTSEIYFEVVLNKVCYLLYRNDNNEIQNFKSVFITSIHNAIKNYLRLRKIYYNKHTPLVVDRKTVKGSNSIGLLAANAAYADALELVLLYFNHREYKIFKLYYLEGYTDQEIADKLNCARSVIIKNKSQIIKFLVECNKHDLF